MISACGVTDPVQSCVVPRMLPNAFHVRCGYGVGGRGAVCSGGGCCYDTPVHFMLDVATVADDGCLLLFSGWQSQVVGVTNPFRVVSVWWWGQKEVVKHRDC